MTDKAKREESLPRIGSVPVEGATPDLGGPFMDETRSGSMERFALKPAQRTGNFNEFVVFDILADHKDDKSSSQFSHLRRIGPFSVLFQVIIAATATGSFLFGINLSNLNSSINTIGADFGWLCPDGGTDCNSFKSHFALIQCGVLIGAAVGAMTAGYLLVWGCRILNLFTMGVFILGIIFELTATAFANLFVARLVVGYAVGLVSVTVPTYIAELAPPKIRGAYGVFHQLLITIGIFIGVLLGLALSDSVPPSGFDKAWWRVMLGLALVPVAIHIGVFGFFYTFQTPYHYLKKGDVESATALLQSLLEKTDVSPEVTDMMEQVKLAEAAERDGLGMKSVLKNSTYLYVVVVGCAISAFQQLSGINVFITSSNRLFTDAGLSSGNATIFSTVLTLINVLMTFPAIYLIEKLGRRTLLLAGVTGMGLSVLPGAIMFWIDSSSTATTWVAIAGAIGFIISFASTYGPVLWVYLFEIYPVEIKNAASGLATGVNWTASIILVFAASYLSTKVAYTVFFVMNAINLVLIWFTMKESKGIVVGDSPFLKRGGKSVPKP